MRLDGLEPTAEENLSLELVIVEITLGIIKLSDDVRGTSFTLYKIKAKSGSIFVNSWFSQIEFNFQY